MLSLYALLRFALSRSPLREQRELMNTLPSGSDEEKERLLGVAGEQGKQDLFAATDTMRNDLLRTFGAEKFRELTKGMAQATAGAPEVFASMLAREEVTQVIGPDIARSCGITLPPPSPADENRSEIERLMTAPLPSEQREVVIERLLHAGPRVTLTLLEGLHDRLSQYEEQMRIVEQNIAALPRVTLTAVQQADESAGPGGEIDRLTEDVLRQSGSQDETLRVEVRGRLQNMADAQRRNRWFGIAFWQKDPDTTPGGESGQRSAYAENLRKQIIEMTELLQLQLQQRAIEGARRAKALAVALRQQGANDRLTIENRALAFYDLETPFVDLIETPLPAPRVGHPEFTADVANVLRTAEERTTRLMDAEKALRDAEQEQPPLGRQVQDQQEQIPWAERCTRTIDLLLAGQQDDETRRRLNTLRAFLQKRPLPDVVVRPAERAQTEQWLQRLSAAGSSVMDEQVRQGETGLAQAAQRSDVPGWLKQTQERVQAQRASLPSLTQHPIFNETKIGGQTGSLREDLEAFLTSIERNLFLLERGAKDQGAQELRAEAEAKLSDFERAMQALRSLIEQPTVVVLGQQEFESRFGPSKGTYENGTIYVNSRRAVPREATIRHEQGHAILDLLVTQERLLPNWIDAIADQCSEREMQRIAQHAQRWGISRQRILEKCRQHYGDPNVAEQKAEEIFRRQLVEEYAVRRALASGGEGSARDRRLFEQLDNAPAWGHPGFAAPDTEPTFAMHERDDEEREPGGPGPAETGTDPTAGNLSMINEALGEIEMNLMSVQTFLEAFHQSHPEIVGPVSRCIEGNTQLYRTFKSMLETGQYEGKPLEPAPVANEWYIKKVKELQKAVAEASSTANMLERDWADPEKATPKEKGLWSQLGIRWLSIYDIMKIAKDLKEDWVAQQNRRTERITAEAQRALTDWVPENLPTPWGKYLGGLKHYARRRENQAELDAVGKWEKAFENLDAEELFTLMGEGPTRDQLRGSIQLLCKRGHMDWSNESLWKALEKYSRFKMPYGPCRRSEFVRDQWVRNLITDIWGDKEMYYHLRTQNDTAYDAEKKKFTAQADSMSNVRGKTASELELMLKTWIECHEAKPPRKVPESVNIHKFEELLHYSMRNGKMSMEQKIYFLIRGVASGFLSVDRLRVLAGERGELLMKFPFLDYFYQRHNTMSEIRELADRLTEHVGGKQTFAPGTKTTMFMRLVLLRDMKARERMSKAISKASEGLDHEDIPYLATEFDWGRLQNMFNTYSGTRSKVSVEGCKNAYVGFSEKLKVYAHLAQLAKEGKATFTIGDTRDIATSLAAFIFFDNQMMQVFDPGNRVKLTDTALNESTVANPACTTAQFRNSTRDFVKELSQAVNMRDEDLQMEGGKIEEFVPSGDRDRAAPIPPDKGKKYEGIAMKAFAKTFVDRVAQQPTLLMDLLTRYQDRFLDSTTDTSGRSALTYADFKSKYRDLMAVK